MPQKQKIVEVKLKDGSISKGIATCNNAAWKCVCGRMEPLLGRSGLVNSVSDGLRVDCPDCRRKYFVVPDGKYQARVLEVVEID
jgi:hypothetical protein